MNRSQYAAREPRFGNQSASLRAKHTRGVRFVYDYLCAVPGGERGDFAEWRSISFHTEKALDDDEFLAAHGHRAFKMVFQEIQVEVRKDHFASVRKADAVDEAGMVRAVRKYNIIGAKQRAEQA